MGKPKSTVYVDTKTVDYKHLIRISFTSTGVANKQHVVCFASLLPCFLLSEKQLAAANAETRHADVAHVRSGNNTRQNPNGCVHEPHSE